MANEEDINELNQRYQQRIEALELEIKAKDREIERYKDEIAWLRKLTMTMAERPINVINEAKSTSESNSMSESPKYDQRGAQFAGGFAETVQGDQIGGNIHNYAAQQNLTEAAAEIQQLLEQLSQTYPTNTRSEQMVVVDEAIKRIEGDPTLKERVIGAIKSGGIEAFKEAINHPLVNILVAFLQGWQTGN